MVFCYRIFLINYMILKFVSFLKFEKVSFFSFVQWNLIVSVHNTNFFREIPPKYS